MRLLAILPLLLLSGCVLLHGVFGFDLTPNAVHCGQVLGVDVWVDQKDLIDDSEPKYSVKAMSCAQAMHTVVQARDVGAQRGLWEADRQFPDYRLEFISARRLGAIDSLGSDQACGYTLTWSHRIAVAYGHDYLEESDPPEELHSSGVILLHELIHVKENGNISHCHWASKYPQVFKGLKHEYVQGWDDLCEHQGCAGSSCWDRDSSDF